jgi:mono/diheme cytochrome c family protein
MKPATDLPVSLSPEELVSLAAFVTTCTGTESLFVDDLDAARQCIDKNAASCAQRRASNYARSQLSRIAWEAGRRDRGKRLVRIHRCRQCHSAEAQPFAPQARDDFAMGVLAPNKHPSPHPELRTRDIADLHAYLR